MFIESEIQKSLGCKPASEQNCPPTLTPTLTLILTCLNPNPNREAIFLGGNCPDTIKNLLSDDVLFYRVC